MEGFKEILVDLMGDLESCKITYSSDMLLDCATRMWATKYIQNGKSKPTGTTSFNGGVTDNKPTEKQISFAKVLGIVNPESYSKSDLRPLIDKAKTEKYGE